MIKNNKYKYCVFVGRFQPFHNGHYEIFKKAKELAENVIIVIGSHNKSPDIENPFSSKDREKIIKLHLSEKEQENIDFIYIRDSWYNQNKWLTDIQHKVSELTKECDNELICFIGAENYFPQWNFVYQKNIDKHPHATQIRKSYFELSDDYKKYLNINVVKFLEDFKLDEDFQVLKNYFNHIKEYKKMWELAPFPPTFVTTDSVVIKSGHILLVKRKDKHGAGQYALPGGFLEQNESIKDGAVRELKEETSIKIDKDILINSIKDYHVFDYPKRSLRGRTITHAYLFDLNQTNKETQLPIVNGASDADKAFWISLNDFYTLEECFFEDHFQIILYFISKF